MMRELWMELGAPDIGAGPGPDKDHIGERPGPNPAKADEIARKKADQHQHAQDIDQHATGIKGAGAGGDGSGDIP
jgi:hypothetical protein